ncbi:phytanoyl-CoA dioxygenase family protein [Candidatus Halobonum tyrrellensis]|uniref:Phytanoyl-CoA dioxygenase n=1 Tax=Candidatus Halobonum tyrrellensis G22 TaxID=1324957 RepID=V4GNW3_9EURY|nr:phytanoyl-CoA dioxygenase family protein [Candidatus Halobonum tyrrellensis]ESP87081.1 phytanoyl-CoA dioxygenase [Candidatus Halobonum tyrrellensis G22]
MNSVSVGEHELEAGDDLVELRDSTDLLGDPGALRTRLAADGYLYLRGFHDPDLVRAARRDVLEHLAEEGVLDPEEPVEAGVVHPDYFGGEFDMSAASWTHYPNLEELAEGERVMEFFAEFLDAKPLALDRKLGRAKATGEFTGFHVDRIFVGRGTEQLYTVWRPIGDCPLEQGPLVVCPGSHRHDRLRETYGRMDVDRDVFEAPFSEDPHDVMATVGGPLATTDFAAGDALVFGPYLLHGSLSNRTDRFRISVDTRYQSVEEPVDGRWVGADPIGHYDWPSDDETPMADLRAEWGL